MLVGTEIPFFVVVIVVLRDVEAVANTTLLPPWMNQHQDVTHIPFTLFDFQVHN